jgi:hypothetical protein
VPRSSYRVQAGKSVRLVAFIREKAGSNLDWGNYYAEMFLFFYFGLPQSIKVSFGKIHQISYKM